MQICANSPTMKRAGRWQLLERTATRDTAVGYACWRDYDQTLIEREFTYAGRSGRRRQADAPIDVRVDHDSVRIQKSGPG